jgi:hypothetical protein
LPPVAASPVQMSILAPFFHALCLAPDLSRIDGLRVDDVAPRKDAHQLL